MKLYILKDIFIKHSSWETAKICNGTIKSFAGFVDKHILKSKSNELFIISHKWVFGIDPLDLLLGSTDFTITYANLTVFSNGYFLVLKVDKEGSEISLNLFLEFGPKGFSYAKKISLTSSDVFSLPENGLVKFDTSTNEIIKAFWPFSLFVSKEDYVSDTAISPVIDEADILFYVILLLLVWILIVHYDKLGKVFPFVWRNFKKVLNYIKGGLKYIPLGIAAALPYVHRLFGYGNFNVWMFDMFITIIRYSATLCWWTFIAGGVGLGVLFLFLLGVKLFSSLGLLDVFHDVVNALINWWHGNLLNFPVVPQHQIGGVSSSSSEETQALVQRLRRLVNDAGVEGSQIARVIGRLENDVNEAAAVLIQEGLQEQQQNNQDNLDLKLGVLRCVAILMVKGVLKGPNI